MTLIQARVLANWRTLLFGDDFTKASTKHFAFQLEIASADPAALEGLRELTLRRDQACRAECYKLPHATLEDQAQWFVKYLALLRQFVASASHWEGALQKDRSGFIWSSPLSSYAADARFSLRSVHAEEIMALFMYAALLQQQAYDPAVQPAPDSSTAGADPAGSSRRSLKATLSGLSLTSGISRRCSKSLSFGRSHAAPAEATPGESADTPNGAAAAGTGSDAAADTSVPAAAAPDADHAAIVTLYRRAAGVLQFVAEQLLPAAAAAAGFPAGSDCPVELHEGAAAAMQALCLAQAQGVAALRAELRGTSPALVAALHCGAAELYEQAASTLRSLKPPSQAGGAVAPAGASPPLSERLRRFLAISATRHEAKGLQALAASCRAEMQLGQASACLRDGLAKVRQCLVVCEKDEDWKAALQADLQELEVLHKAYEKERQEVYSQRVPAAAPTLPAGRCIVTPIAYASPECGEGFFK
ncbi:hypothetical protein N2152v2_010117 [Parachlorella kessleri]